MMNFAMVRLIFGLFLVLYLLKEMTLADDELLRKTMLLREKELMEVVGSGWRVS